MSNKLKTRSDKANLRLCDFFFAGVLSSKAETSLMISETVVPSGVEAVPLLREAQIQFMAGELGSHQISPDCARSGKSDVTPVRVGTPIQIKKE